MPVIVKGLIYIVGKLLHLNEVRNESVCFDFFRGGERATTLLGIASVFDTIRLPQPNTQSYLSGQ
jgi:hypothetical protein